MHADILAGLHGHVTGAVTDSESFRSSSSLHSSSHATKWRPRRLSSSLPSAATSGPVTSAWPGAAWQKGRLQPRCPRSGRGRRGKGRRREEGPRSAEAKEAATPRKDRSPQMRREPPRASPRADWPTIPATRPLRPPIGCCFPPGSRALPASAPPAPPARDGGGRRRSRLRAREGFGVGQRQRHLPPRQRHSVALEALWSLPPPEGR